MSEQIKIDSLEPWTRDACLLHRARALSEGVHTLITDGYRTPDEQMEHWRCGRELRNGEWVVVGKVVTKALPEHDAHCRRAAYDLWVLYKGKLATMDTRDGWNDAEIVEQRKLWGAHVRIGREIRIVGSTLRLVAGADWPTLHDWPHFERADWRSLPIPK